MNAIQTTETSMVSIPALTMTDPWGTLVAKHWKRRETRCWQTSYRGPIAIHIARGFPAWAREMCLGEPFTSALLAAGYDIGGLSVQACKTFNLPLGCVIALAVLVDIEVITPDNTPPEPERAFGNYTPGRYMWVFDQVQELSKALSASGALRLWQWHPPQVCQEELDALLQQMKRDQHDSHTTTL